MKLQKNTLFALYSVLESAARPQRPLSAGEIARKYRISPHHLAKVLHTLARARVVESVRGARGGYCFAGNARRLTLMDVIALFESISAPARRGARQRAKGQAGVQLALARVLAEVDEIAKATFGSITIATMLKLVVAQGERVGGGSNRPGSVGTPRRSPI